MDFIDVQTMFGMNVADLEEYTFMTNIVDQDENLFDDMLVVLIKSEDDNIFDILSSHIEAKKMNIQIDKTPSSNIFAKKIINICFVTDKLIHTFQWPCCVLTEKYILQKI